MPIINHNPDEELVIPETGKFAVMFHLPGHCAGCKVALANLEKKKLEDVIVTLVDAEDEKNKSIVESMGASTAPTIILFVNGEEYGRMSGLKEFLMKHKSLLGE